LLGAVSAHELGHLLLGSNSHSRIGIMEPRWRLEGLRNVGMGRLLFTSEQARSMRNRISAGAVPVTLSGRQYWRTGDRF
jgi:hypothetical protein